VTSVKNSSKNRKKVTGTKKAIGDTHPVGRGFLKDLDLRIFTQDEIDTIWEQFFGKRYSLGHIAQNFDVRKEKIIAAIDQEAVHRYARK
jgi:hypothetical protein